MEARLYFTHLSIKDFRSVESLEIDLSQTTLVAGRNGAGKTTVLLALNEFIQGGHHAEHIRQGAKKAVLKAKLSDGSTVTKTITPKGSSLDIDSVTSAPQTWLNRLADKIAADPLALLDAKPAERGKAFTEALAVSVPREDLVAAAGMDLPSGIEEGHGLAAIERARKMVYDKRREANVAAKEKRSTIEQLAKSMPGGGASLESLQAKQSELQAEQNKLVREGRSFVSQVEAACARMVEQLMDEREEALQRVREEYEGKIAAAKADAEKEKGEYRQNNLPRVSQLTDQIARLSEQITHAAKAENTREVIARMEGEAAELEATSGSLTEALERLDQLKARLMSESPIEGLEVREDGEVYVNGIAFAQLNTAAQYDVLLDMAILRAGDLGLILFDRLESLDPEETEAFLKRAKAKGVQVVAAKVTSGDFTVTGSGEPAGDGASTPEPEPAIVDDNDPF